MATSVERRKPVSVVHGRVTLGDTAATVLGASFDLVASEITVKAAVANASAGYLGSHTDVGFATVSSANGFELRAGQQVTITAGSPSDLYVIGAASDIFYWIAS
tara:strand:+ start:9219 stop:9530 length:312 start_codon:yes stop_codon:yes gene_type:complete